jgi:sugar phosphate permease
VIGFWCINVNIGNIIGSQVGGLELVHMNLNWGWLLVTVAAAEIFIGLIILIMLNPEPGKVGIEIKEYENIDA